MACTTMPTAAGISKTRGGPAQWILLTTVRVRSSIGWSADKQQPAASAV